MNIAKTPKPPYYAVIFTSVTNSNNKEYDSISNRMVELVKQQHGFLGFESAREEIGITVSYWESLEAIRQWKANLEHQEAQKLGKESFYKSFKVRITRVEREYSF